MVGPKEKACLQGELIDWYTLPEHLIAAFSHFFFCRRIKEADLVWYLSSKQTAGPRMSKDETGVHERDDSVPRCFALCLITSTAAADMLPSSSVK